MEAETSKQRGRPSTHPRNRTLHADQNQVYSFTDQEHRGERAFTRSLVERKKEKKRDQTNYMTPNAVIAAKGQDIIYNTLLYNEFKQFKEYSKEKLCTEIL